MTLLNGKRILITRDASQAGGLREKLETLGGEVFCVPTISISEPPDWSPFDAAAQKLLQFDWIIFSSVNAVSRTSARLSHLQIQHNRLNSIKMAAVGSQTAKSAIEFGWRMELVPDRFQAEDLLNVLLKTDVSGKQIWIPRALEVRPLLGDELRKAGAQLTETPVYQNTVPFENQKKLLDVLTHENIDWITFTSSSTVTNFFKILGEQPSLEKLPKLASIGNLTTKTLRGLNLVPIFTADPQNLEGLCQGILDAESL